MRFLFTYTVIFFLFTGCKHSILSVKPLSVEYSNENIIYQGRIGVNKNHTASEIYWSGSSIKINFEGTSAKAILEDENGSNYFNIIIDGTEFKTLKLDQGKKTYTLAEHLPLGAHAIEITKRNDWTYGTTLFYGFEITGSKVLPADKKKSIFIEFYGDSITVGHGNEDYSENDSSEGHVSNNYNTYAAMTARHIDAEYSCIARSGIGIMVSWFNMTMPEMFYRLNPNDANSQWDFSEKQADIIVVNLFQNDSWLVNRPEHIEYKRRLNDQKPTESYIINAYRDFISTLRNNTPNAHIICLLGNMDITKPGSKWPEYVQKAVNALHDNKVHTCFVPYKNSPGHPKKEEHVLLANTLIQLIKRNILLN